MRHHVEYSRVVDLTHPLDPDFPTWSGQSQLSIRCVNTLEADGWNVKSWAIDEHTGTHLDAPFHKSTGATADQIPAADLVGPLAVVDIRDRVAKDADAVGTAEDLRGWEHRHGPLPPGSIVALCSGWDLHLRTPKFRNAAADGTLHFPGWHADAAAFLLERDARGLMVDTLSLDPGNSTTFPVHARWLGAGRWGVEGVARLAELPPAGSLVIVGGPKVVGATGGPCRVFALV